MEKETVSFEDVLSGYFRGWKHGYRQALDDVDTVIDEQTEGR